jgi:RecJ-like exonuclease
MVRVGNTCRVCGVKGKVKATEKLPDGFAMEATHDDGTLHKWVKYYSLDSIGRRKTGRPNIIVCPKCGKKGRVNSFRPYQDRPDLINMWLDTKKLEDIGAQGKKSPKYDNVIYSLSSKEKRF